MSTSASSCPILIPPCPIDEINSFAVAVSNGNSLFRTPLINTRTRDTVVELVEEERKA